MAPTPTPVPAAALPNLEPTVGLVLLGVILSSLFHGITLMQTFYYYRTFSADRKSLKSLVAVLTVLDTLQLAFLAIAIWDLLIPHYGNFLLLVKVDWTLPADVVITTLIAFCVQLYMITRVWTLSKNNRPVVAGLTVLAVAAFVTGVIYGVKYAQLQSTLQMHEIIGWIDANLSTTLSVDVLITASLMWFLHRGRTGFVRTDNLIDSLITYTVTTGLITSVCALLDLITHKVLPATETFFIFYMLLPTLYVNSLLATLNIRSHLRNQDIPMSSVGHSRTVLQSSVEQGTRAQYGGMPIFRHDKTEVFDDAFVPTSGKP